MQSAYRIRAALALHTWDQETYMPQFGGDARAAISAELAGIYHELLTDPVILDTFASAQEYLKNNLLPDGADYALALQRFEEDCKRKARIPKSLDQELASTTSLSQQAWSRARISNAPEQFLPWLQKVLDLKRQEAACLARAGQDPYEVLLQTFEPGMQLQTIEGIFSDLHEQLQNRFEALPAENNVIAENLYWPQASQESYVRDLLGRMGFCWETGRLDKSAHPFSEGLHCNDVRITVRYRENEVGDALFSALHEGGHGLYEQGFIKNWIFTPLAEAASLGMHESQSRFWENCLGRSHAFWQGEYFRLQKAFPQTLKTVTTDQWIKRINRVSPSFIRVDADELTYNLHIILRWRMERALLSKDLPIGQLEDAWNEESRLLLGIVPPSAREGFLQDVHWSFGAIGYFPTYTLGNLYAAELRALLEQQQPDWQLAVASGDFSKVLQWLREQVHQKGRKQFPSELMESLLGRKPNCAAFLSYLDEKREWMTRSQ